MSRPAALKTIRTETLEIAYEESGEPDGKPVVLLHGFPDDPRAWDGVAGSLTKDGFRTIVP
jgi:pimeloyl-ACP methyl ester carboxylesterase